MSIRIESVLKLGKGITVKIEKQPDDTEKAIVHLKFAECIITREMIDEFITGVVGLVAPSLFDELGAPIARMVIGLPHLEVGVTGRINGNVSKSESLAITNATLGSIEIALIPNGGHLSGELTWEAAGDEISDAERLLGATCACAWIVEDGRQPDLLKAA